MTTSSQRTDIVSHLDEAHKVILAGGGILNYSETGRRERQDVTFSFARAQNPYILTLLPAVTTATITATRNSNSVSFAADPNAGTSIAGYFIRTNNEDEVYRVSAHTAAATTATLDGVYVGSANLSAATCEIFKLHYQIGASDILQLISPIRCYNSSNPEGDKIKIVDKDELLDAFPLRSTGMKFPESCAVLKELTGNVTVQMSSYPDALKRIEVDYIPIPTTLDTSSSDPIIPSQYRKILSYLAAHYMAFRNGDTRAPAFLQTARMMFSELVEWNERLTSAGDPDHGRVIISGFGGASRKRIGVQKSFT